VADHFPLRKCVVCTKEHRGPEPVCGSCVDELGSTDAARHGNIDDAFSALVEDQLLDVITEEVAELLAEPAPGTKIITYDGVAAGEIREIPDVEISIRREIEEANDVWTSLRMDLAEAVAAGRKSMRLIFFAIASAFFALGFGAASLLWMVIV